MRCMECGGKLHKEQSPMEESYKGRKYTIDSVSRYVCESCGEYEIDADEELRVSSILAAKYRQDEGLLTPEQIRSIRVSLGLTQKQFEELIGVSSPTASRWETGAMFQSKTADKFIRVLAAHPEIAEEVISGEIRSATSAIQIPSKPVDSTWNSSAIRKNPASSCFKVVKGALAA